MKKIAFIFLSIVTGLLALSASVEFGKILKNFSLGTKAELFFALGFVAYLIVHLALRYFFNKKQVSFIHILGHELTHVLMALPFGGKPGVLNVDVRKGSEGGKVLISKSNFFISLAPYFFPLYALFFTLIYFIVKEKYMIYAAFCIGASLSFHIVLTLNSMKSNQSDFHADSDFIFSIIFIYFMNIIMIALVLAVLSPKISFITFIVDTFKGSFQIIKAGLVAVNTGLK